MSFVAFTKDLTKVLNCTYVISIRIRDYLWMTSRIAM